MSNPADWTRASFRVSSRTMSAAEIHTRLGSPEAGQYERGTLTSPRNPASVRREESIVIVDSGMPSTDGIMSHLEKIAQFVEGRHSELASIAGVCSFDVFSSVSFHRGRGAIVLTNEMLRSFARVPIEVIVNIESDSTRNGVITDKQR